MRFLLQSELSLLARCCDADDDDDALSRGDARGDGGVKSAPPSTASLIELLTFSPAANESACAHQNAHIYRRDTRTI